MLQDKSKFRLLHTVEILYLLLLGLSFYLLVLSKTDEAQTVWHVLQPAFMPVLFLTTTALVAILLSSEKTSHKLFFVIVHSILIHSFFSIIFPAGDLSGQQMVLGRIRRVYDNTVLHGLSGWPNRNIQVFIIEALRGLNLQAALTTIFARILSLDILYVHLFFVPVLWGIFVPVGSFLVTKELGGNDTVGVLAALLVSAFPFSTYFGAISVSNSLGFIFFLYSLYFMLKYLGAQNSKIPWMLLVFSFFSFFAHFLTGVMSASLLLLTLALKAYRDEKGSFASKLAVVVAFIVCLGLLPVAFVYLEFFGSPSFGIFTLEKLGELSFNETVGLLLVGDLIYGFNLQTIFLMIVGPAIAFICMLYLLRSKKTLGANLRVKVLFLLMAFLLAFIDYRILKLFMENLPLNPERLWVFRDLISAPFVAIAIVGMVSFVQKSRGAMPQAAASSTSQKLGHLNKRLPALGLILVLFLLVPLVVGGWVTFSLSAAYPHSAPLQTTSYELEAVRYIQEHTEEKYVVIGDIWTIYAGEAIVGINNPNAYYFAEFSKQGHDLFANMTHDPSPEWMLSAMNDTKTQTAYFMFTETRVGTTEFNNVALRIQEPLMLFYVTENGETRVYSYSNSTQS